MVLKFPLFPWGEKNEKEKEKIKAKKTQILRNENVLWREHWFYRISNWVGHSIWPSPERKYNLKQEGCITGKGGRGKGSAGNAL